MSLRLRRLERLARTRSPALILRAAGRAVGLRRAVRELERSLRSDRALVVGPFLGELGYELLYWRPYVLRLLRSHAVDPARVTLVGRGGSGRWYGEFGAGSVDVFDLIDPEELRTRTEERVRRTGQRKQVAIDDLDRELLSRASAGAQGAGAVHPLHMFWTWRFAWEGLRAPAGAVLAGDYDPLPRDGVPGDVAALLPERFVAVKAYFNECVPDSPDSRAAYAELVRALAGELPVVLLQPGFAADDHDDWAGEAAFVRLDQALRPETNLAVQAAVVARAAALVSTYGGFSYLGPFLGVPTVALGAPAGENRNHEQVLRAALPASSYERFALPQVDEVVRAVRAAAG